MLFDSVSCGNVSRRIKWDLDIIEELTGRGLYPEWPSCNHVIYNYYYRKQILNVWTCKVKGISSYWLTC